jgi:hypothetical protein
MKFIRATSRLARGRRHVVAKLAKISSLPRVTPGAFFFYSTVIMAGGAVAVLQ